MSLLAHSCQGVHGGSLQLAPFDGSPRAQLRRSSLLVGTDVHEEIGTVIRSL
jgi:hypothetical protein